MDTQVTFPCSVNSVPFWQSNTPRRSVDAAWNMGQQRYIDSLLTWQSKIPYNCKALFVDTLTFQFKTQQNSAVNLNLAAGGVALSYTYTNQAKFHVCKSKIGSHGYPVPGDIVSAFEAELNPTAGTINPGSGFWGIQNPLFDTYTNPITGITQQLVSYMWQFSFGDFLSQAGGDSGIYFLMFDNYNGTTHDIWYSEPILVYGADARHTTTTDRTLLFQGYNTVDKSDILINAIVYFGLLIPTTIVNVPIWFNNPFPFNVIFSCRVEADILEYEAKGIYLGFLQENWLQENTLSSSWETFALTVGSNTNGIPATLFRIISKYIEFDYLTINNQFYMYDLGEGGTTPTLAWKMKKPRVKGLISGTLPIRYRYPNQLFANPLPGEGRIFTDEFDDTFD